MKNILFLLPILLCACGSKELRKNIAETKTECGVISGSIKWKYCITPGSGDEKNTLLYYFHGGGGNEKAWVDPRSYAAELRKIWSANNKGFPTVVAVSFGRMWLLTNKNELPKSGLYEVFKEEVMPHIEKLSPPKERLIMGESMGGFNAGTFGLRNPNLFSKIALICPSVGVAAGKSASLDDYIKETGAQRSHAQHIYKLSKKYFSSQKELLDQSPIELVKSGKSFPKIFISCGDKDQFGFFKGSEDFVSAAKQNNVKIIWEPTQGKHCSMNIDALAEFLNSKTIFDTV